MDWDRIGMLLHICQLSLPYPQLKAIHDAAFAELLTLQNPPAPAEPVLHEPQLEFEHNDRDSGRRR